MIEEEWLASRDAQPLLKHLQDKANARKLRLYAIACCLRLSHLLFDERSRQGLIAAEDFCEGRIKEKQRAEAERAAGQVINPELAEMAGEAYYLALAVREATRRNRDIWNAVYRSAYFCESAAKTRWDEVAVHAALLRDIFGNPFRPITFDPTWRTSDVLLLARGIYDERAFDRMPIFADALQDAGCDNNDLLTHCRDPHATHVRGCWALDLVLGKE